MKQTCLQSFCHEQIDPRSCSVVPVNPREALLSQWPQLTFFINVYIQYLIVLYVVALYLYRPLNIFVLTEKTYNFKARFLFQKWQ